MSGWMPIAPWKIQPGTVQAVPYTGTSAETTAVGSQTRAVLLYATSTCHIRYGQGAQAAVAATDFPLPGGASPLILGCSPGDRFAAVQDTAGGTLWLVELTH